MGRTLAIFQSSGYIPIERERLKMAGKNGDKIAAAIFKTLLGILSGPVALLRLMIYRVFKLDSKLITANEKAMFTGLI